MSFPGGYAVIGSYVYTFAGNDGSDYSASVERARIDADGSLDPFSEVPGVTLLGGSADHAVTTTMSHVYALGGYDGVSLRSIERIELDASGEIGDFTAPAGVALAAPHNSFGCAVGGITLLEARRRHGTVVAGNYLYVLGGFGTSFLGSVERASIDAAGDLGTFATVPAVNLGGPRYNLAGVVIGNSLFALGGEDLAGSKTTVERAILR